MLPGNGTRGETRAEEAGDEEGEGGLGKDEDEEVIGGEIGGGTGDVEIERQRGGRGGSDGQFKYQTRDTRRCRGSKESLRRPNRAGTSERIGQQQHLSERALPEVKNKNLRKK